MLRCVPKDVVFRGVQEKQVRVLATCRLYFYRWL
jgi:hypothetical protein